jgi:hypothetical protein
MSHALICLPDPMLEYTYYRIIKSRVKEMRMETEVEILL